LVARSHVTGSANVPADEPTSGCRSLSERSSGVIATQGRSKWWWSHDKVRVSKRVQRRASGSIFKSKFARILPILMSHPYRHYNKLKNPTSSNKSRKKKKHPMLTNQEKNDDAPINSSCQ
jgi:hypothetical protein